MNNCPQSIEQSLAVSKKRSKVQTKKDDCISSPGVATPTQHSSFYDRYEKQMNRKKVLKESLTAENYKTKFHILLCWEEQEHDELLTKR